MRLLHHTLLVTSTLFVLAAGAQSRPAYPRIQTPDVRLWTRHFLDAYARQDSKAVLASIDSSTVMYGSDATEVFHGRKAIHAMLASDSRLWAGKAHIGEMTDISVTTEGLVRTIFFQAPFSLADAPPLTVRFCLVWKRSQNHWLLLQSSNAVVTTGQSAAPLLKQPQMPLLASP